MVCHMNALYLMFALNFPIQILKSFVFFPSQEQTSAPDQETMFELVRDAFICAVLDLAVCWQ